MTETLSNPNDEPQQSTEPLPEPVQGIIEAAPAAVDPKPEPPPSPEATIPPITNLPKPPDVNRQTQGRRKKRGSLFFPILLIVLGVVLLLNNLNLIPGTALETLINLWPVLLIVWGLDSIWREEGLTGAIFLLGLGIVFLLSNFDYIQLNPWQVLLLIWPVVLVAIGVDILLSRHRTWWLNLLGLIFVAAIMAGALWLAGVGQTSRGASSGEEINYAIQGADRAEIQLSPSAATIELGGPVAPGTLLAGTVPAATTGQEIIQDYTLQGSTAKLVLRSTGVSGYVPGNRGAQGVWKLGLSPDVPIALGVDLGAGNGTLDLSGLQISDFNFNMGVGDMEIILPAEGNFTVSIDNAIGNITLVVPSGMAVQLESNTFLVYKNVPESLVKTGSTFTSTGFRESENQVTLDLGMVFGQVTVEVK